MQIGDRRTHLPIERKYSMGLHCVACDAMFDSNDFDDELCLKCYMVMLLILDISSLPEDKFDKLIEELEA